MCRDVAVQKFAFVAGPGRATGFSRLPPERLARQQTSGLRTTAHQVISF